MIRFTEAIEHRYRVLNGSTKRGFRISKFTGDKFVETMRPAALMEINRAFSSGEITREVARSRVDAVADSLYVSDGAVYVPDESCLSNYEVLERFWKTKYRNRELEDKKSAYGAYRRAIDLLGTLNIQTATQMEIQDALNQRYPDHRQRQVSTSLNVILKWLGRTDALTVKRKKRPQPLRHLTFDQFQQVLTHIEITEAQAEGRDPAQVADAFRIMCKMALYTGCRIGELFGLQAGDRTESFIRVQWQIDKVGQRRPPKRGKVRRIAPFKEALELFPEWLAKRTSIPHQIRLRASHIVKQAAKTAFPNEPSLHVAFHDLRHSHAIACLEKSLPIELVARNLGNQTRVTEEYYLGFTHTDHMLEKTFSVLNN